MVFCCKCDCAWLACLMPLEARRCLTSWDWSFSFELTHGCFESNPGPLEGKRALLNHWANSRALFQHCLSRDQYLNIWMLGPQKVELLGSIRCSWGFWGFKSRSHSQFSLPCGRGLKMAPSATAPESCLPACRHPPCQMVTDWICALKIKFFLLSCLGQVSQ